MTPGAVFHPGHEEWHGQTVVVSTNAGKTFVGRWDAVVGETVQMMDAAVHDAASSDETKDAWVARLKQYGVPVEQRGLAIPRAAVTDVVRLRDA